jgi:hypothetical protein
MVKMIYQKDDNDSSDDDFQQIPNKIILNEITEQNTVYSIIKNEKKL